MANAKKVSSIAFFIGILFFAIGIFLPNSFFIGEIQGWFGIGVIFFLIGGYYFIKANDVKMKDLGFGK